MTTLKQGGGGLGRAARESFNTRGAFILAAIGSAVGLGNIWRFPYVAYESGGGAFIIPYLVALLTAGIPLLFFDYAIGHRYKGSPPLAFRRMGKGVEAIGWWQVLICFVIGVYYAAIVAWAAMYTYFSFTKAWGDDPEAFFFGNYLELADAPGVVFDFVDGVWIPMVAVWLVLLTILGLGVRRGIAKASLVAMPVLIIMFLILVGIALTLPGSTSGLDALFTPDWAALANPQIWIAAYGQIFFSLSIGFGIMVTYSSYLKRRSNLTGSGLVVGFSNSAFEILAAIGVFAALGFMAQAANTSVDGVVTSGLGLAFVAFPAIISQAPMGSLIGVLFFGSLVFAGFTSLVSILEVVISAVKDKLGWSRGLTTAIVGGACAIISVVLFGTTTGVYVLDVSDAFVNNLGIVGAAFVSVLVVSWGLRRLPALAEHLNAISSFKVGMIWRVLVSVVMPIVLGYLLIADIVSKATTPYEDMPLDFLAVFGWGMSASLIILSIVLAVMPWPSNAALHREASHEDDEEAELVSANTGAANAGATDADVNPDNPYREGRQ
ncbi:sodium-dependent transporter [Micrococcoides hystricis]|uniref:Transporter n=1 Tax=Micrococcoides hystricis TaxID=1572761 RepID=A0ABV6P7N1_9MICC